MIASVTSIVVTARQHIDAGHAWLEVAYAQLEQLGIAADISSYSYRDGDTVYLEEDCDEPLFLDAATAAGWDIRFETVDYSDLAPLRDLPRYRRGASAPSWRKVGDDWHYVLGDTVLARVLSNPEEPGWWLTVIDAIPACYPGQRDRSYSCVDWSNLVDPVYLIEGIWHAHQRLSGAGFPKPLRSDAAQAVVG